jgi:hypothetical protein
MHETRQSNQCRSCGEVETHVAKAPNFASDRSTHVTGSHPTIFSVRGKNSSLRSKQIAYRHFLCGCRATVPIHVR